MSSRLKKNIYYAFSIYVFVCILLNLSYDKILNHITDGEQLLFSTHQYVQKDFNKQYIVYLDEEEIIFYLTTDVSIAPFELAHVPKIKYKAVYNIDNPRKSEFISDISSYNLSDKIEEAGIIIKGRRVSTEFATTHVDHFYFGYRDYETPIDNINNFTVRYNLDSGYFFMFEAANNPDYNGASQLDFP